MTHHELNAEFTRTRTTPAGFIAWAASLGYTVAHATVSRQRAGTQGITTPWAIAYRVFFREVDEFSNRLQVERKKNEI